MRSPRALAIRAFAVPLLAALLMAAAVAARADEQSVSTEEYERLKRLYVEARELQSAGKHADSTLKYESFLSALPAADATALVDPNRALVCLAIAQNSAVLGQKEAALEKLRRAVEHGYWNERALAKDPTLAAIRGEKEFSAIAASSSRGLLSTVLKLPTVDGKALDAKSYAGSVVIVDVWGTWCGPCRRELPHFKSLVDSYHAQGLRIIGLNWENSPPDETVRERVRKFAVDESINYPCVLLPADMKQLIPDLAGFPTTFFFAHDGRLADRITGYQELPALEGRVIRLLRAREAAAVPPPRAPRP